MTRKAPAPGLSFARLHERGCAILAWEAAGGSVGRLATLARRVSAGRCTDWPGRPVGGETRDAPPVGRREHDGEGPHA